MRKSNSKLSKTIICRCEEVYEKEIIEAVHLGLKTLDEVKKATRAGMGLCQGKICTKLVERIMTREADLSPKDLIPPSFRPPVRPLPLGEFREHPRLFSNSGNKKGRKK